MQSLSSISVKPWIFTTLNWFEKNIPATVLTDKNDLLMFINALQAIINQYNEEIYVPIVQNDLQRSKYGKLSGPLVKILDHIKSKASNKATIDQLINDIIDNGLKNKAKGYIEGKLVLDLVRIIVMDDNLWNDNSPVGKSTTMKYLIAEIPANVKSFLIIKGISEKEGLGGRSDYFKPPLRDIALAFLGSILTFVSYIPGENGENSYIYIGMSPDTWTILSRGGSAKDIVERFRPIRNIFRQVFNVEFSLPLEFALIYAAARISRYMPSKQIRRQIMIGNYLEILTLSRGAKSQNFVTQLDTYSIDDYLIALRRTRMTRLITSLAGLLRHYECFKDNKGLAKDIAGLLNDVTVRVVRFVSNNDCSEIAELTYGVKSFIAEWGDVISNVKSKKHGNVTHQRIVEGLKSGLELVRC